MAYSNRRSYTRKSRMYKKKSSYPVKKRYQKRRLRKLADQLSKYVGEKKFHIGTNDPVTILSDGEMFDLTAIAQGVNDTQRDGDQITLTSIELRYVINNPSTVEQCRTRVIIFQWFPVNNVGVNDPTLPDVLLKVVGNPDSYNFLAPYSHDKRFQFRILYDRSHLTTYQRPSTTAVGANANSYSNTVHLRLSKFPRHKIQYLNASTSGQNKIFMLVVSNQDTNGPSFQATNKVNYHDN